MLITDMLPEKLKEDFRIIPAEHTLPLTHYMKSVARKLLGEHYDLPENHIRFVVSDMDVPEIFSASHINPPVIGLSSGLLKALQSEDELAAAIASQIVHVFADSKIGERLPFKGEEIASDVVPLLLLQHGGYNPKAMVDILKRVHSGAASTHQGGVSNVIQNKLSGPMRIRVMENAEFAHRRLTGTFNTSYVPLPDDITSPAYITGKHKSHMHKVMDDADYAGMDVAGKLRFLHGLLEREKFSFSPQRGKDVADALAALRVDQQDSTQAEALNALVNTLVSRNISLKTSARLEIYTAAQMAWSGKKHPLSPLGNLHKLQMAMAQFKNAHSAKEAENAGEVLSELAKEIDINTIRSITENIGLPTFLLPGKLELKVLLLKGEETRLPWAKHVTWALQAAPEKAALIGAGLAAMGVDDARSLPVIHRLLPKDRIPPSFTSPLTGLSGNYRLQQLEVGEDFTITGMLPELDLSPEVPEAFLLKEKARLYAKEAAAKRALESVNWQEMEQDFQSFVKQYATLLAPERAVLFDDSAPFAREFISRLKGLSAKEPHIYQPLIEQFLTGDTGERPESFSGLIRHYNHIHAIPDYVESARGMPFGASLGHPLVEYALDNARNVKDRLGVVAHCRYLDTERKTWNIHPDAILGEALPNDTYDELQFSLYYLREQVNSLSEDDIRQLTLLVDIASFKIKDFLEKNPELSLSDEQYSTLLEFNTYSSIGLFNESLSISLGQYALREHEQMKAAKTPVGEIVRHLESCSKSVFSLHFPAIREALESHIREFMANEEDVSEKHKVAETLLCSGVALRDGELREMVISSFTDGLVRQLGEDDNTPAYREALEPVITRLAEHSSPAMLYDVLSQLAEKTVSQEKLSYHIRDTLLEKGVLQQYHGQVIISAAEMLINNINSHKTLRHETINFLRSPLTEETATAYAQRLSPELTRQMLHENNHEAINTLLEKGEVNITPRIKVDMVKHLHHRIWDMPAAGRIAFLEKIIFPPGKVDPQQFAQQKADIIQQFTSSASGGILPPQPKQGKKLFARKKNSQQFQGLPMVELVHMLLDNAPEPDQRLLLTGIMFAAKPGQDKKQSTSKAIAEGLMAMGPAGVKLAQAIDGMEKRQGIAGGHFAESKKMSQNPARWKVFDMLRESVPEPENVEHQTKRVGKVLGAGAYGVTIARERNDNVKTANTVLPGYVRERAEYEFANFERAVRKMAAANPDYIPLIGLVKEARHMAHIETDMDVAATQAQFARDAYDGLGFEINGQQVRMSAAPWIRHGKNFKETEMVSGMHFNDMPVDTPQQRQLKQVAGKAAWAAEQSIRLRGMPTDHDRHGAQQLIEMRDGVLHIQNFDFGAMDIEPPTEEQKKGLVNVLFVAARNSILKRMPLMEAVTDEVKKFKGSEEAERYIRTFGRAAVAMSDFESEMRENPETGKPEKIIHVDRDDKLQILGTIFASGEVDPVIEQQLKKHLGPVRGVAMGMLKKKESDGFRIVHYPPMQAQSTSRATFTSVAQSPQAAFSGNYGLPETIMRILQENGPKIPPDTASQIPVAAKHAARHAVNSLNNSARRTGGDAPLR